MKQFKSEKKKDFFPSILDNKRNKKYFIKNNLSVILVKLFGTPHFPEQIYEAISMLWVFWWCVLELLTFSKNINSTPLFVGFSCIKLPFVENLQKKNQILSINEHKLSVET